MLAAECGLSPQRRWWYIYTPILGMPCARDARVSLRRRGGMPDRPRVASQVDGMKRANQKALSARLRQFKSSGVTPPHPCSSRPRSSEPHSSRPRSSRPRRARGLSSRLRNSSPRNSHPCYPRSRRPHSRSPCNSRSPYAAPTTATTWLRVEQPGCVQVLRGGTPLFVRGDGVILISPPLRTS